MNNFPKSRREFLLKIFSNKAKSNPELAPKTSDGLKSEKIKMLDSDGNLVEVDLQVFKNCNKTAKVKNEEILKWIAESREIY